MEVLGIPITTTAIVNAYKAYYPQYWANTDRMKYLHLFGIRVSTYNTGLADDYLGAIRMVPSMGYGNTYEITVGRASLEPAPLWLTKPFDAEARAKGGAAILVTGQHKYFYRIKGIKDSWKSGGCAFCPSTPPPVYRWNPTDSEKAAWRRDNTFPLSRLFEDDLRASRAAGFKNSRVKFSDSRDTCIHTAWRPGTPGSSRSILYNDSAGCQVMVPSDRDVLKTMCKWAVEHINKGYPQQMTYTLFGADQFYNANR